MEAERKVSMLQNFAGQLCARYGLDGSLAFLCRFLAAHVPAERILCLSSERKNNLVNILIDYNMSAKEALPLTIFMEKLLDWEVMSNMRMLAGTRNAGFINDISECVELADFFHAMGLEAKSSLGMILYEDVREDRVISILLLHGEEGVYGANHVEILELLVPLLEELIPSFLQSHSSPYLYLDNASRPGLDAEVLLRRCPCLDGFMRELEAVARTPCLVLLQGESGTGKELAAETIHRLSAQSGGPLVKVNCAAIPESLLASELFGHEKGAFTGAQAARRGYFEQARNGTLYLDEIGELPLNAQAYLLRVLEGGVVRRVGGERDIPVSVRVVAATNRDLADMAERGAFRKDLYYRLNAYPLRLPPLRERRDDIPVLVQHFYHAAVRTFGCVRPPRLSARAVAELKERRWPGNVRELRLLVERSLIRSASRGLALLHVEPEEPARTDRPRTPGAFGREEAERVALLEALRASGGRIHGPEGAAAALGLNPNTVRYRMRKYGIPLPRDRRK